MTDDIVTRLNTEEMTKAFYEAFPTVVTLEDAMRQALEAANEIERLRGLLLIFDTHFVCDECEKACATYLQGCENPLHSLHTAAWELF